MVVLDLDKVVSYPDVFCEIASVSEESGPVVSFTVEVPNSCVDTVGSLLPLSALVDNGRPDVGLSPSVCSAEDWSAVGFNVLVLLTIAVVAVVFTVVIPTKRSK